MVEYCGDDYSVIPEEIQDENCLLATMLKNGAFVSEYSAVRPIPECNNWFETVWAEYLQRGTQRV